ncbi:MAG: right-handed parallel beta-helix repeat-containing protein [Deltaproteobacteria bacterium]|nr:right-handed parallel beta-helix repeat-containing protein [Deltaproteobacteria bacterium]
MNPLAGSVGFLCVFLWGAAGWARDITMNPGDNIRDVMRTAAPGDRVLMRAGTYPGGGFIGARGTASAPITVLSVDGPRRAVLQGGTETLRIGDGASYLIFDGLEVRNSGDNTIHIDSGAHHIWLRNLYAHDAGFNGDVLKANQAASIFVEGGEYARGGRRPGSDNPYQECIDFVDINEGAVRDAYIHDNGSSLMYAKGASRNIIFERNVIADQRAGASEPMAGLGGATDRELLRGMQFEVFNIIFRNNIVIGGNQGALGVYDGQGVYIANNLFVNNDRVLIEFRAGEAPAARSENVRVVNNIFLDTRGRMPEPYRRSSHGLMNFTTSHNLFWNNGAAIPGSSVVSLTAQPGHLVMDPGVPALSGDRAAVLAAGRPRSMAAAGSGMDASGAPFFVTDDVLRAPRGGRLDRGPFTLGGTVPPTDGGGPDVIVPDVPVSDTGVRDTGTPPRDTGTAPRDTGTAQDTAPPQDSGADTSVPTDSMPTTDTDDGGLPTTDAPDDGSDSGLFEDPVGSTAPGCGCRVPGGRTPGGLGVALGALAAFGGRRRPRRRAGV